MSNNARLHADCAQELIDVVFSVIDTEIGNLNRLTELNRIVVCNLFRVRTVERENSDMIERANQSAATNSMRAAVGEARAEFGPHPVLGDRGSFVVMAIEGTGLRKSLYRCPPFEWRTSGGMETMRDMYITVSDVVANVPLCFEKVDENTVKLTDIGDDIKLHDIPAMMDAVHRTIRYATAR